jgi:hypothetical protein
MIEFASILRGAKDLLPGRQYRPAVAKHVDDVEGILTAPGHPGDPLELSRTLTALANRSCERAIGTKDEDLPRPDPRSDEKLTVGILHYRLWVAEMASLLIAE